MFFSKAAIISLIQILPFVHSKNIQVLVGQNNTIVFSPNTVKAALGDTVEFLFLGGVSYYAVLTTMLSG
jgi:plastocyanin